MTCACGFFKHWLHFTMAQSWDFTDKRIAICCKSWSKMSSSKTAWNGIRDRRGTWWESQTVFMWGLEVSRGAIVPFPRIQKPVRVRLTPYCVHMTSQVSRPCSAQQQNTCTWSCNWFQMQVKSQPSLYYFIPHPLSIKAVSPLIFIADQLALWSLFWSCSFKETLEANMSVSISTLNLNSQV